MKEEIDNYETIVKINKLNNRYVTDGNIWTIDETMFNDNVFVFLVINIKTRAILGYIIGHKKASEGYIKELYKIILDNYPFKDQSPLIIHSDAEDEYFSTHLVKFFKEENIDISVGISDKHQNQVSEAVNNRIKFSTVFNLLKEGRNIKAFKDLVRIQPAKFKHKSKKSKAQNKDFRKWFFNSEYFEERSFQAIEKAITEYNERQFSSGITRKEAEYYNTKLSPNEKFLLFKSSDDLANKIQRLNKEAIQKVKGELTNIIQSEKGTEEKIVQIQALVLEQESVTQDMLITGFTVVMGQNQEIIDKNKELRAQINILQEQILVLTTELEKARAIERAKQERKEARAKRKRLPKRDPVNLEIYEQLITSVSGLDYTSARIRIAFLILMITGIRVNELLQLKVEQLLTLVNSGWIGINRSKRGPSSHKAYLTPLGKKLVDQRNRDFEIIFAMKELDGYVFTSEKDQYKPLRRETLTREINLALRNLAEKLTDKPNLTSHSFRAGFITQLWRDTNDIEFVRQAIGHIKVESTSSYVENLSDEERRLRMEQINNPEDLII